MKAFTAQLRRELWEHPVLYVAPVVIGVLLLLLFVITLLPGVSLGVDVVVHGVDLGDPVYGNAGMTLAMLSLSPIFVLPLIVIVTFYLLDALSTERRDRSILFFKSLPISDVETVLSKLATALLVAPVVTVIALVATQIALLLVASIALGGNAGSLAVLWSPSRLLSLWALALYTVLALGLWFAPSCCFLLAVSAWARRATLIWACSPLLLIVIERALTGRSLFERLLRAHASTFLTSAYRHRFQIAVVGDDQARELLHEAGEGSFANVWGWMNPIGLFSSPMLWTGLVIAAAFVAAAVYVRRYRADT